MRDPFPALAAMRAAGPVIRMRLPLIGKCWVATSYEAVGDVLKGADKFASDGRNVPGGRSAIPRWLPRNLKRLGDNILLMDDPDHRRLRKLVDAPFLARRIDEFRPEIARISAELLDRMEAEPQPDVVRHFARPLPLTVICEMLGLAGEDKGGFMEWTDRMMGGVGVWAILSALPALGQMLDYIRAEIAQARAGRRSGLLAELVLAEEGGDRMSEDELVSMVTILFVAGHETTTHLISTSIATLHDRPDIRAELTADPALIPGAVEELHRQNSPVSMTKPRIVREDMVFHGVQLKRGDKILANLAAANSDPDAFAEPLTIDIRRQNAARHLGYGGGIHLCLGLHLARAEAQIALGQVLQRFPDLSLVDAPKDREWITRLGLHGYRRLPVVLGSNPVSTTRAGELTAA